jgi:hypothetical protein
LGGCRSTLLAGQNPLLHPSSTLTASQTNNLEWYDPSAVTTRNGSLEISLYQKENHGLHFMGGLVTTWNKFCFTGGLVEASVVLPGANNIVGLWPAVWAMGNLGAFSVLTRLISIHPHRVAGRAGYGASLEGMVSPHSPPSYLPQILTRMRAVAVRIRRMRRRHCPEPDDQRPAARGATRWRPGRGRRAVVPAGPASVALHVPGRAASRARAGGWVVRGAVGARNRHVRGAGACLSDLCTHGTY